MDYSKILKTQNNFHKDTLIFRKKEIYLFSPSSILIESQSKAKYQPMDYSPLMVKLQTLGDSQSRHESKNKSLLRIFNKAIVVNTQIYAKRKLEPNFLAKDLKSGVNIPKDIAAPPPMSYLFVFKKGRQKIAKSTGHLWPYINFPDIIPVTRGGRLKYLRYLSFVPQIFHLYLNKNLYD